MPNKHTGLWTSKKSFHVLQPSLITVMQSSETNENFNNSQNNLNKYNIFNLNCGKGCHLNKVRSLLIEKDKKIYRNFLFNTSYSRIILSNYHNTKESKSISISNIKPDIDLTYSTTLSNSYPLTHYRTPFSIFSSAFTSFYSPSNILNSSSPIPSLDGIWIGTFGQHGLEFIYIKTYNIKPNPSKKDSLFTLNHGELPILINNDVYSTDEEEEEITPLSDQINEINPNNNNAFDSKKDIKKIIAYKITGDVNIPKGEISWSAELNHPMVSQVTTVEGRTYDIARSHEFRNAKIFKAEGIFAQVGYRDIKKHSGKCMLIYILL